ncbi:phage holin family protein [Desertibacillus haloalkaliphilus]|uniref:phage holin family protein n=1 Tax=Desertibacillus haloalkaliphilus TaxID=1328930 RepID=UPI001C26282B|nr:phage holin family protein [Desertibacillus haloalkaliphilus]MBU8908657.1 phage holin family protein [Desertibacillus haloalkaliphilus]
MGWLLHVGVYTVVLMVVAGYVPAFHLSGFGAALVASLLLSVINLFIKPILVILTLPVTFFSLGLFLFVINALLLMLTAWIMGDAFVIDSFWWALLASVVIAILNLLIQSFIINPMRKR